MPVVVSAVSIAIQKESEAVVAVAGIATVWLTFSVDVLPLPPSHIFQLPVRAARPVLLVIGPLVPVQSTKPDSKPGFFSRLPDGVPPPLIVHVKLVEPDALVVSFAVTVTLDVAAVVGVPEM